MQSRSKLGFTVVGALVMFLGYLNSKTQIIPYRTLIVSILNGKDIKEIYIRAFAIFVLAKMGAIYFRIKQNSKKWVSSL